MANLKFDILEILKSQLKTYQIIFLGLLISESKMYKIPKSLKDHFEFTTNPQTEKSSF